MTQLEDLPALRIDSILDIGQPALVGRFTHLKGVRLGRSWLFAGVDSLIGDLVDLDKDGGRATFVAPFWTPASPVQVGSSQPWLEDYWEPHHLTMILDPNAQWLRHQFVPSAAQYFRQEWASGWASGWAKAGKPMPAGAVPTHTDPEGWDHEHCEICGARIGVGGETHGYVDQ